jgi:CheY-like chemotaxis protein
VMMPKMNGIDVLKAVKGIHPDCMVIVMTGYSTEDLVLQAFQHGASNYLKKPFDFKSFSEVIDQVVDIHRARRQLRITRSQLLEFEMRGRLVMPNDPARAGETIGGLINEIRPFVNGEDADSLHMCLYELVMNGIEHGVFRIGYDLKTQAQEESRLTDLYEERMTAPEYVGNVYVTYEVTPAKCVFTVEDTGEGFDVSSLPDPTIDDALLMSHGRGVMLTKMIADHLEYNEKGNKATLIKFQSTVPRAG